VTRLVAPLPLRPGFAAASTAPPSAIPFDGEYWMYRWPFSRPPSTSRLLRGKPSALFFKTVDRGRLQMEARQRLDRPLSIRCCRGLTVSILNADIHPGTVLMEVQLGDSRMLRAHASLGMVRLQSVPDLSQERPPPVPEVVDYKFPTTTHLTEFDEIRVVFHRSMNRLDQSARVSIERFLLIR
jgi:hypothetical protein